jgi:hypothetical protein
MPEICRYFLEKWLTGIWSDGVNAGDSVQADFDLVRIQSLQKGVSHRECINFGKWLRIGIGIVSKYDDRNVP